MEDLVTDNLFGGIYKGRKVLVTGHTGFKGSWLCHWLSLMGAEVLGYSLPSPTIPNHFELLETEFESVIADIRDQVQLDKVFTAFKPEMVFHLAAQPLVRLAYEKIDETFETNVMGSLRVYEACRKSESVKAIVSITTDKVYENLEEGRGFVETDPLGGKDPYSASKAAMEILSNSYRHSYFNKDKYDVHGKILTTVRAGNVIGGGDWSTDRLIPDLIRAAHKKETVIIRSPKAVRPWQHVLECLAGYLMVGKEIFEGNTSLPSAFNFGPEIEENVTVEEVIKIFNKFIRVDYQVEQAELFESTLLHLDISRAKNILKWLPLWNAEEAIARSARWYSDFYDKNKVSTNKDIYDYIQLAKENNLVWCS